MRTIPALAVTAVLLATLTACTGGPFAAGCTPLAPAGASSTLVKATGAIGTAPDVDFPTPIIASDVEAESIVVGDGRTVETGDTVVVKYTLYNGATGQALGSSGYAHAGDHLTLGSASANSVVTDGLQCSTVGSRVAIVASALSVHGGQGDPTIGVGPNDSILYVMDVVDAYPAKASGSPQTAVAGLPSVVTAPNGAPGITIPRTDPPTELTVAPLLVGNGDVLEEGNQVLLKYTSVAWETGRVLDSTWTSNQARIVPLNTMSGLPEGVVEGLVGQSVNSQVLIVIPKAQSGSDTTLVYVIDVLAITPATY